MCIHAHALLLMNVNVSLIYTCNDIKVLLASYTLDVSIAYVYFLLYSSSKETKSTTSLCKIIKIILQNLADEF